MGLDMYLTAGRYFSDYDPDPELKKARTLIDAAVVGINAPGPIKTITADVLYWRKANHIHQWFVKNVQEGVDECQEHDVDLDQLKELAGLCERVLANRDLASELLPTQEGFFFGSTDYDDGYFSDCSDTLAGLAALFATPGIEKWDFMYRSSW